MIKAQILTWWKTITDTEDGAEITINYPHLFDLLLRHGDRVIDISHTPAKNLTPSPNLVLVECLLHPNTYQSILDHPRYGTGSVFFSQKVVRSNLRTASPDWIA